ncbi:MAG: CpsD/CapB family tyrosine-protein kinase [Gemmobacter sp.]
MADSRPSVAHPRGTEAVGESEMVRDPFSERLDIDSPRQPGIVLFRRPGGPGSRMPGSQPATALAAKLPARLDPAGHWSQLPLLAIDEATAHAAHLIVSRHEDPVGTLFDVLRTRLLQALDERGWNRIVVTAPTRGCGTSTVAANLALSMARRPGTRTLLIDLDLRMPSLHRLFGVEPPGPIRSMLSGEQPVEAHMQRVGQNLCLALSDRAEPDAAELLQEPATVETFRHLCSLYAPDVLLYDMPPVLEGDDVLAFLPQTDGAILVVDGLRTLPSEVQEAERLIRERSELVAVVLNRAEDRPGDALRGTGGWRARLRRWSRV